ncbi:chemotaxis protein CheB [Actinomadura kijaniata]|uniref:protein-glutamate methylesterase n=1 Tax=Actinomadura namibiensis TaxID=182080 RepID=A0A7W3LU04_ACTNM|nr:chemotaxis protein CheB [Actinomadura namibiensis]MBA8954278.1 two-component system chemotaxis response regulator CheB [Actinomadura namibiensis]
MRGHDQTVADQPDPEHRRDTVVIAASAGGISAMQKLLARLPRDLPATILGVVHLPATANSVLPQVVTRRSEVPAEFARDGVEPRPGRLYLAPPDRHLLLVEDRLRLSTGPRQNGLRPAADPLFFSAALARGRRLIGVVLSGMLDDGAAGCAAVQEHGGLVAVQDPAEADYDGMPSAALASTTDAFLGNLEGIARFVRDQTREAGMTDKGPDPDPDLHQAVERLLKVDNGWTESPPHEYSGLTCPECGGPLYSRSAPAGSMRMECRIGHGWSPQSLLESQDRTVERALSMAVTQLAERSVLTRRLAQAAAERGHRLSRDQFADKARQTEEAAETLQRMLAELLARQDDLANGSR